jgi:hypothetical protein
MQNNAWASRKCGENSSRTERKKKTTQVLPPQRPKVIGGKILPGEQSEPYSLPSKTARILYHLATQRHRNEVSAERKQPSLVRTEHQTMVKELVKKKKKGQRRAVKRSPPTNAIKTRERPWTNHNHISPLSSCSQSQLPWG